MNVAWAGEQSLVLVYGGDAVGRGRACRQTDRTLVIMSAEASTGFRSKWPPAIDFTGLPQLGGTTRLTRPASALMHMPLGA